jgi:hypothetical protein
LLILSGQKDEDFPPDGYHEVFRRAKGVFDLYPSGDSQRIREVDDDVGHTDAPLFLEEARRWMWRWLKGDATSFPADEYMVSREKAIDLACLTNPPPDAINYSVHERLVPPASLHEPSSMSDWNERKAEVIEGLREKVFRWFPTEPVPFDVRRSGRGAGWTSRYADYQEITIQTEPGVHVRGRLLTPADRTPETPLVVFVERPGDSIYFMDMDEVLPLLGRCSVLLLNPRFTEQSMSASEYRDVQMTSAWTGRTIASMQTWDILRTVAWSIEEGGFADAPVMVFGRGEMGILGLYAALLDGRIDEVILGDPPGSHRQGPALLNILRITDIPEAAGMLAPRRLTVVGKRPSEFSLTQTVYGLHTAVDSLAQAESLARAVRIWKHPLTLPESP